MMMMMMNMNDAASLCNMQFSAKKNPLYVDS